SAARSSAGRGEKKNPERMVLYAHLPGMHRAAPAAHPKPVTITPSHRAQVLDTRIEHAGLCGPRRNEQLLRAGLRTCGDLLSANPKQIAADMGLPRRAANTLARYQRSIRLAARVPGLSARDALLLVSVHRKTVKVLSAESPAQLHRDLQRFALSTRGQNVLRGRKLPSLRRVKRWVNQCVDATSERVEVARGLAA
ncbi:MAG: DUF4332 domain-containing protein, partial [Planctomycetota bacterium]